MSTNPENDAEASNTLSIKVINQSGVPADVAVFQKQPQIDNGFPLVWFKKILMMKLTHNSYGR